MAPTAAEVTRQDAEAKYNKGACAELAKDFDKAFSLYIKAAQDFIQLSRQTSDARLQSICKTDATKALARAERIKAVRPHLKPVPHDEFAEGEQLYILQKSSLINRGMFPLWDSPYNPSSSEHEDPKQRSNGVMNKNLDPQDIMQHIVSDCSVCGAMVIAIDHHRRFGSKMIFSSLFPQDMNGHPACSDSGLYQFRILYNGTYRRISIDDSLPTYPDGTLMCVSTGGKGELWPSLVEKAYMQLVGGYDFIGSDSSTDLYAFTGWIPEVLDMKNAHFQREKTWERLTHGYTKGNCVATLGTGEHVRATDLPVSLLPTHCYAIIGVHGTTDNPRLTIFDPWVQSSMWEDAVQADASKAHSRRTVELSLETTYNLFSGLYLSWNPAMFRRQLVFHGMWKRDGRSREASGHFRTQLQLSDMEDSNEVWVLLTRHLRDHRTEGEYISLTVHGEPAVLGAGSELRTKGEYTNSLHVLVRTNVSHAEDVLTLIASYEGDRDDVGFTLTVFSNCQASWLRPPALLFSKDIEGAFTQKTAGGNHTYPTYYLNTQYHLRVHPHSVESASGRSSRDVKAAATFTISTDRHVPVNVLLAWSQGGRIYELGHNDVALSSGPYSYGHAHASGHISPGDYTVVVSAFEPRQIGQFRVHAECSERFDISPVLQEGAGMFNKVIRGEWTAKTAGGGPSSGSYVSNPFYELQITSTSQLKFRLQLTEPSPATALNLTIFNSASGSSTSLGHHVATSGPYSDAVSGVIIEKLTLRPGRYLVVPSTYKPGHAAAFRLIVYSTVSGVQLIIVEQ